jgi:hypothetical protein
LREQVVNEYLGRHPNDTFAATPASFATFVRALSRAGLRRSAVTGLPHPVNDHFNTATRVTDGGAALFDYYLRLEDMAQWLPCLACVRFL